MPRDASEFPGKFCEYSGGIFFIYNAACDGISEKFQDPSDDHAVADGNPKGTDHRDQPDEGSQSGMLLYFKGFFKCPERAGLHSASKSHFTDNPSESYQDDKQNIGNKESGASKFTGTVGKQPDICHSYRASDAGYDEAPFAFEFIFGYYVFRFHGSFALFP